MRNPPWNKDELILALDTYFQMRPHGYPINDQRVQDLSVLLKKMGNLNSQTAENYRTPASVVMKLMNFRSIDPDYPGAGLTASARSDKEVWVEFSGDRDRLKEISDTIRNSYRSAEILEQAEYSDITEASEGRTLTRLHVTRERNRKLVESKKKKTLKEQGFLACEVCGFDFEKTYGSRGHGFIECHHTKPLHTLGKEEKTNLKDLALLCANCHRMVHSQRPWLSVEELKRLLK